MTTDRKSLNRWARYAGYSDFDTYIRAGGSILDARKDISERIACLREALTALDARWLPTKPPQPEALILEHTQAEPDDPTDPDNAHAQGAEQ